MSQYERIGIIGSGTMGTALLEGLNNHTKPFVVGIFDADRDRMKEVEREVSVTTTESVAELNDWSDLLVLCVKPSVVDEALSDLNASDVELISIAAGVSIEHLKSNLGDGSSVVRVMPNTPAQVGEGMSFLSRGPDTPDSLLDHAQMIFRTVGEVAVIEESKMDAVTALSGSGPAYVFYFLEALEEAGVYLGLDREDALKAARKTVEGAAELQRRSNQSPSDLKADVSSPGGTTVEALKYLDRSAVKGDIKEAVRKAYEKSKRLSD